jgi:hypothetical protein
MPSVIILLYPFTGNVFLTDGIACLSRWYKGCHKEKFKGITGETPSENT